MHRLLLRLRVFLLLAALGLLPVQGIAGKAYAAELKVLASVALNSTLNELAPAFERATGHKLTIGYGLAAELKKRILDGEVTGVAILTAPLMADLEKEGKFAPGSLINAGGTAVSVAARAGAPKPDISSVEAFKKALLAAKSIVYADPAKGGASGVYFARVVDRLGLTEALKGKTILVPGAQAAEVVAKGEAELGVAQASEILPVSGAQWVGPLPGEFASTTVFTAGIGASAPSAEAAKAFIQFLREPSAMSVFKAKGFDPA